MVFSQVNRSAIQDDNSLSSIAGNVGGRHRSLGSGCLVVFGNSPRDYGFFHLGPAYTLALWIEII